MSHWPQTNEVWHSERWWTYLQILSGSLFSLMERFWGIQILMWRQNLCQSTWDHEILYDDRPSKDEQLLMRLLLWRTKKYNGGWLKVKIYILFYGDNSWTIALQKWSLVQWKITDIPTSFIWIIIFFYRAFEHGDDVKFWGYVGINAEPLCVEFCNFVNCLIFVNHVTCYYQIWCNSFLGMIMA
jgi:hypothetical protein